MIYAFFVRNQHRRRIARAIRLINATQAVVPYLVRAITPILGIYARAWRGDAG